MRNRDRDNDDEQPQKFWKKHLSSLVLTGTVFLFVGIAWFSSNSGSSKHSDADDEGLLVVEADKTPMKEKPVDAGGMQFPNQDKTVFETFSNSPPQVAKVERVLPTPEEPIITEAEPSAGGDTHSPIAGGGNSKISFADKADEKKTSETLIETAKEKHEEKTAEKQTEKPLEVKQFKAVGVEEKQVASISGMASNEVKKVEKPAEKAKSAVTSAVVGSGKIQLGAYGSEAEAKAEWAKMQKKFAELAGKSPVVVKANVNGKDFYRLRATGFKDAKATCKTLSAKGQACILPSS